MSSLCVAEFICLGVRAVLQRSESVSSSQQPEDSNSLKMSLCVSELKKARQCLYHS